MTFLSWIRNIDAKLENQKSRPERPNAIFLGHFEWPILYSYSHIFNRPAYPNALAGESDGETLIK